MKILLVVFAVYYAILIVAGETTASDSSMAIDTDGAAKPSDSAQQEFSSSLIVLTLEPMQIGHRPTALYFPKPGAKVFGSMGFLCFSIANSGEYSETRERMKAHDRIIEGVNLNAVAMLVGGDSRAFSKAAYAWSDKGKILEGPEISSCMVIRADQVANRLVERVEVRSDQMIRVFGVYWESSNEYE